MALPAGDGGSEQNEEVPSDGGVTPCRVAEEARGTCDVDRRRVYHQGQGRGTAGIQLQHRALLQVHNLQVPIKNQKLQIIPISFCLFYKFSGKTLQDKDNVPARSITKGSESFRLFRARYLISLRLQTATRGNQTLVA